MEDNKYSFVAICWEIEKRTIGKLWTKAFLNGKTRKYVFGKEHMYLNSKEFFKDFKKNEKKNRNYWGGQSSFRLNDFFSVRYMKRKKMLTNEFLPLFCEKPRLIDIGCGSGEWTAMIAPYCREVVGQDYSEAMIQQCIGRYGTIPNVCFISGDARSSLDCKKFNGALQLGLLMYMKSERELYSAIKTAYDKILPGGYLLDNNTINLEECKVIFLLNPSTGYNAAYWSKDKYLGLFERVGFKLIKYEIMDTTDRTGLRFAGIGTIWQKV